MTISRLTIQKLIAVTAIALAIPAGAQASPREGDCKAHRAEMRDPMRDHSHGKMGFLGKLDLTDSQKAQIEQILTAQRSNAKAAMAERHAGRDELKALAEQDRFDSAKAERLIGLQQEREKDARLNMLRTQHEIYKVLTPEQREKARAMRTQWKEKMKDRHEKWHADPENAL